MTDYKRRKAYPATVKEKIHYNAGIQPVEQEIEYVYKAHITIQVLFTRSFMNFDITHRTTMFLGRDKLLRDLQEAKHKPTGIDPARLEQIMLHDLWTPVPQEEVDKMAASLDPDGRPLNAPGRKWRAHRLPGGAGAREHHALHPANPQ